jgi:transposase
MLECFPSFRRLRPMSNSCTRSVALAVSAIAVTSMTRPTPLPTALLVGRSSANLWLGRFRTTPEALAKQFADIDAVRVAIENGTHSIWMNEQLRGYGHEVIVANVQELQAISRSDRKSDRVDAEKLASYARLDPNILRPISHRSVAMQQNLTVVRARDVLVRLRTATINAVRGLVKPCGFRLPKSATSCFAERCLSVLPPGLAPALKPLLEQVHQMSERIKAYDQLIAKMAKVDYPETRALDQVHGVGTLTALTFVLTIGNKHRFQRSRDVGCYLGLRPRRDQSGGYDPQLRITKAGKQISTDTPG